MALLLTTLIILTCVLLIIIVLVQNPKGGGLSSSFGGGGTQLFGGVKKTSDFLRGGTWVLAIALVVLVLFANVSLTPQSAQEQTQRSALPDVPTQQPQTPQGGFNMPEGFEGEGFPEDFDE